MSYTKAAIIASETNSSSRYVTHDLEILQGEPIVIGTKVAVRDIVVLWKSGIKPEEIPAHLFNLVTLAQIFDALSFYCDHSEEVDRWIALHASHPSPLLRLSPFWDEVIESITTYRQELDANPTVQAG